ncbi:GAF domain-containing protein [Chloroflexota bacterium]
MGLQKKASLYGGVGLLFLVGILVFIGVWVVREATERSLNERVAVAQMVARGVDQALLSAMNELERLAVMVNLEDKDTIPEQHVLDNLYTFSGTFSHVFLVDSTGKVLNSQPLPVSEEVENLIAADPGISQVLNTSSTSITNVAMTSPASILMFSVSVPIHGREGKVVGVATGHLELSRFLSSFIQPLGLGSTAYMEVVNEEGVVMASSKSPAEVFPEETEYAAHFVSLIHKGEATMETCFRCHDTGKATTRTKDVLAFAPLSTVAGGVAIRQSEAEALASSHKLLQYMLLAGSPLLILGLIFTWMSPRTVVRPVLQLTAASRRIADGNLDVPITANRSDELGLLAQTFDRMRLELKDSLAQKEERAVESENRARHLVVLNAIATTVGHSLDLERVLHDSLEQVLRLMPIESGCIYLKEGESPQLQLKAHHNFTEEWMDIISQLGQEIGVTTEVVFYDKVTNGESVTFVRVPLTSKAQSLGVMWLASPGLRRFTSEEIDLLTSIGHQVGVAVDNARLFQEAGQRESEAQALHRLGIEISRLLDLDRILTTVVDSALNLQKADGTILALYDEVTREVYVRAISGSLSPEFSSLRLIPSEESLIGRVLSLGSPKSTFDYLNDPDISHGLEIDNLFRKSGLKSCLAVPLKIGERISGVLMAVYKQKSGFSYRETELLQQLANQAAVAIETARLYDQVQELAIVEERARLSREMHDSLGQVLGYVGLKADEIGLLLASEQKNSAVKILAEIKKVVRGASDEVRHAILALRTPVLPEVELPSMLREYLESFRQQTGIQVSLNVQNERAIHFSPKAALQLVRVIQEALSNVRKHAQASEVEVRFEVAGNEAVVSVTDNGVGFEPSQVYASGQHFGIQVMDERMVGLGGNLEINSRPGEGTQVLAKTPLEVRANGS